MKRWIYIIGIAGMSGAFLFLAHKFFLLENNGDLAAALLIAGGVCAGLALQCLIFEDDDETWE